MFDKTIQTVLLLTFAQMGMGQVTSNDLAGRINIFNPAVPFLTYPVNPAINGVITSVPDGKPGPGIYGNHSLLALDKTRFQSTVNYYPWNSQELSGIKLFGVGSSYRLNEKHVIGMDFRFFSLGTQTSAGGVQFNPYELAGSLFYTYNINKLTGIGIGLKYIYSDLICDSCATGVPNTPGKAIAADISFARKFPGRNGKTDQFLGVSLNNVGTKISYSNDNEREFIPTSLTAGYGIRLNFSSRHTLLFSYECSKLLIPTPPYYSSDSVDINGDPLIEFGYNPNVGVFRGMIQSFYDAPGGFQEEMHEITHAFGMVYHYRFLSAGIGYFYQSPNKGHQEFYTYGLSGNFKLNRAGTSRCRLSFSYLKPVHQSPSRPNTFQVGLCFSVS
jgi:hypothetical protein